MTALAAMETGKLLPSTPLDCTGSYTVYSEFDGSVSEVFHNVDPYINESMTLPTALAASCDTWFYQLGYEFYKAPASEGHPLQAWAAKFGFGRKTGVDVGPESRRAAADARVAQAGLHRQDRSPQLADRQPVEARRLDPARDRPEGPARHAAADGPLLRR